MIPRSYDELDLASFSGKVLLLFGPRQVGKTTLLKKLLEKSPGRSRLVSGEDLRIAEVLGSRDFDRLGHFIEGIDLLAIDEAQAVPGIGDGLKILVDQHPSLQVIATGSSSFELAGQVGEPLTGRKRTLALYPLAQAELIKATSRDEVQGRLAEWLIYGTYPAVVTAATLAEKRECAEELAHAYLLKDVFAFEKLRSSQRLLDLLRLVAFQVGSEVSLAELGRKAGMDGKTVARYLDILEKAFVLAPLRPLSRNLRNEIGGKAKYYFWDTGIRNALIANFNELHLRDDVGKLWENFLVMERLKKNAYARTPANTYFWRTFSQQEVDYVEEQGGQLSGFEFTWGQRRKRPPSEWTAGYPKASFQRIDRFNYLEFLL